MLLSLDPSLYKIDQPFWYNFIQQCQLHGHRVICFVDSQHSATPCDHYTLNGEDKRVYAEKRGLKVDVWIERGKT